jgi:hypothetical protein
MLTVYMDEFGLQLSFSVCASLLLQKQTRYCDAAGSV